MNQSIQLSRPTGAPLLVPLSVKNSRWIMCSANQKDSPNVRPGRTLSLFEVGNYHTKKSGVKATPVNNLHVARL